MHHLLAIFDLTKQHGQRQLEEEGMYLAYTSTELFIIKGSQDMNLNQTETWKQELMWRPWSGTAYWLIHMTFLVCFLIEPSTICLGMASPRVGGTRDPKNH